MALKVPYAQFARQLKASIASCHSAKSSAYASSNYLSLRRFSSCTIAYQQKFTKEHEWIKLDSNGNIGTVGISTYAANALGDVVYVELPKLDSVVNAGDTIGAVESVKSASDIMTPLSGKIVEVNSSLEEKPSVINRSPETEGWIAKLKVENTSELNGLMSNEEYKKFLEEST